MDRRFSTPETSGSTPFRFSTHVGDVGHTLIVGPTGAGKSVLLSLIAMGSSRRYPQSQLYVFDKGNSARAAVLAMNGAHHELGSDGSLAFQPLRGIDDPAERSWAAEWIGTLLDHEKIALTPEIKETLWSALTSLASAPLAGADARPACQSSFSRTRSNPRSHPYHSKACSAVCWTPLRTPWRLAGLQCFETETLLHETSVVLPVLTYLFHRLEARFTGRPTLLILDEAWVFLDNPLFAARIREWLKVLRKKNVSVVFATQSLADIARSTIAPAIIESCPQRLFLLNERAMEPQGHEAYERFGLNDRQIELIARAVPKRQYYLQSRRGNRLFELGLGPIALGVLRRVLTSRPNAHRARQASSTIPTSFAVRSSRPAGSTGRHALQDDHTHLNPTGGSRMKALRTILLATGIRDSHRRLAPVHAQWVVFDPQNYAQNLLEAARALQQINNQIQSLQNEAMMLQNMGKNLTSLNTSQLGNMVSALTQISTLMNQAQGIAFNVNATNASFTQTYPTHPIRHGTPQRRLGRDCPEALARRHGRVPADSSDTGRRRTERPGRYGNADNDHECLARRRRQSASQPGDQSAPRALRQAAASDPEPDGGAIPRHPRLDQACNARSPEEASAIPILHLHRQ